jgi:hypothetical protein
VNSIRNDKKILEKLMMAGYCKLKIELSYLASYKLAICDTGQQFSRTPSLD